MGLVNLPTSAGGISRAWCWHDAIMCNCSLIQFMNSENYEQLTAITLPAGYGG